VLAPGVLERPAIPSAKVREDRIGDTEDRWSGSNPTRGEEEEPDREWEKDSSLPLPLLALRDSSSSKPETPPCRSAC